VIGVIYISKLGIGQFDEDDVRLIEVLAGHASVALENARLYDAQRREAQKAREIADTAQSLLDFSRELVSAEGLDEVLERIAVGSTRILGALRASVWLQDSAGAPVRVRASFGHSEDQLDVLRRRGLEPELAARLLAGREPFVLHPDLYRELAGDAAVLAFDGQLVAAPLEVDGRLGVIAVALGDLPAQKLELLAGLAHQAKLAIANAGSFEGLEITFLSTIEALANALEANDAYTSEHARSITDMSLSVGVTMGLDARTLKRLELGALFHDIGKIGVPTQILRKPGHLTDEERLLIEQHPDLGAKILAPIERLGDVREIVRACHERWDGKGYPRGLAGTEIPIEARIIFVCDAYDAMTTDRPYRSALPDGEARRRLREAAGTQFDPEVVEVFLALS
jgi:HD-GYP domain-containing protein (c-di-GMP phosphodiesterase class II)